MSRGTTTLVHAPSTAELGRALDQTLPRHLGRACRVVSLERRPSLLTSSYPIEELDVRLDDGTGLPLVFKNLSRAALTEHARRAKPAFLTRPMREIDAYRQILAPHRLGTATCYGAIVAPRLGRHWLFLERVAGVELYQVGDFTVWQHVARWLAALHTRLVPDWPRLAGAVPLLRYDAAYYRLWLRRAQTCLRQTNPAAAARIASLAERYDAVVERLVALPVTVLHGEFYPSNVLVQQRRTGLRVCPVDWEMAAVGPGLIDVAALVAGAWTEQEKQALALAYREAMEPRHGWAPRRDEFLAALDACRLHLAVQWLGWSARWSPPRAHAQDWLGEALMLADRLGV